MPDIDKNALGRCLKKWREHWQIPKWDIGSKLVGTKWETSIEYVDKLESGAIQFTRENLVDLFISFPMTFDEYHEIRRLIVNDQSDPDPDIESKEG
jgi:hypothetical protein